MGRAGPRALASAGSGSLTLDQALTEARPEGAASRGAGGLTGGLRLALLMRRRLGPSRAHLVMFLAGGGVDVGKGMAAEREELAALAPRCRGAFAQIDFVVFSLEGLGGLRDALKPLLTEAALGPEKMAEDDPFSFSGRVHALSEYASGEGAEEWADKLCLTLKLRRLNAEAAEEDSDEDDGESGCESGNSCSSRSVWRGGSLAPRAGGGGCRGDSLDSLQHLSRDGFMRSWLPSYANVPDSLKPDGGGGNKSVCHITFFVVPKSQWRTLLSCNVGRMEVAGPPRCHPTRPVPNPQNVADTKPIWGAGEVNLTLDVDTGDLVPVSSVRRDKDSLVVTADAQRGELRLVQCLRTGRIHLQWLARQPPAPENRLWPTPQPPENEPEEDLLLPSELGNVRFKSVPCPDGEVLLLEYKNRGSPGDKGEEQWRRECFWLQQEWLSGDPQASNAGVATGEEGIAASAGQSGADALAKQLMELLEKPPKISLADSLPFAKTGASVTTLDKNGMRVETVKPSEELWKPIVSASRGSPRGGLNCSKIAASLEQLMKPKPIRDDFSGDYQARSPVRFLSARLRQKKAGTAAGGGVGSGGNRRLGEKIRDDDSTRGSSNGDCSTGNGRRERHGVGIGNAAALRAWFDKTAHSGTPGVGSPPSSPASITGELDDAYSECAEPHEVPLQARGEPR